MSVTKCKGTNTGEKSPANWLNDRKKKAKASVVHK